MAEADQLWNGQPSSATATAPRAPIEKAIAEGRDVLFDIDWQEPNSSGALAEDLDARVRAAAVR